jgi:hypothetical protein
VIPTFRCGRDTSELPATRPFGILEPASFVGSRACLVPSANGIYFTNNRFEDGKGIFCAVSPLPNPPDPSGDLIEFSKKAAEEMKDRLAQALGEDLPHVMTFHALAYALVPQEGTLMFDDPSTDQWGLSREVQEVIDEGLWNVSCGPLTRGRRLNRYMRIEDASGRLERRR